MARRLTAGAATGTRHGAWPGEVAPANLDAEPARPSAAPPPVGDGQKPGRPAPVGFLRRAWKAPPWAHACLLAVILLALAPFVGTGSSFSADEGAAIVQARSLARGDGWIVDHPFPAVDPDGRYYPLELSAGGPKGVAPFAKHPLYALVLAGADRVGGITAMVLLSVAGTVAAAALSGALAGRIGASLARPALWIVGLGSPLLFDGYLVIAHTIGAALAAGAVLCALRALDDRSVGQVALACAGVFASLAAAVLFRTEATLFALALAATASAVALRRRNLTALVVVGISVAAAGSARLFEGWWVRQVVGGVPASTGSSDATSTGLAGRLQGFRLTWLRPSYNGPTAHDMALVAVLLLVVAVAVVVRRRPQDRVGVILLSATAAIAALGALGAGPDVLTPGLVMTFPAAVAGVLVLRRGSLSSDAGTVAAGTFAIFAAAVLATQYPQGGSGEWGGRYFALGLPLLVPVALAGLACQRGRIERIVGRVAVGALVVCTMAISTTAIVSLRSYHRSTAALLAMIDRAGAVVTDGTGVEPVLVTTRGAVPRLAWGTFDRQRWLLADPDGLPDLVERLRAAGVARFGLVTNQLRRDEALLGQRTRVLDRDGRQDGTDWQVLVVELGPVP